jgi:hypothetical protein
MNAISVTQVLVKLTASHHHSSILIGILREEIIALSLQHAVQYAFEIT